MSRELDVVARLRELDARSGGRRVAWGPEWRDERERFLELAARGGPGRRTSRATSAGNLWARVAGESPETVVIGSHLDCVPDGGWLDGCLGVLAAAEVLRSLGVAAAVGRAGRLGRRGGLALRPLAARLVGGVRPARRRRRRASCATPTASRCPTRWPRTASS